MQVCSERGCISEKNDLVYVCVFILFFKCGSELNSGVWLHSWNSARYRSKQVGSNGGRGWEYVTVGIFIFADMRLTVLLSPLSSLFVFVSFNPPTHLSQHRYRGCWSKNEAKVALNWNAAEMAVQTNAFTTNNIYWIQTTRVKSDLRCLHCHEKKKKNRIQVKK